MIGGIAVLFSIFVLILVAVFCYAESSRRNDQRDKVDSIYLGMPEKEMLLILGTNYNRSLLKNGRTKYEFRFSESGSFGVYGNGMSMRTYHGVRKVTIYCKDGFVEEVRPYNV